MSLFIEHSILFYVASVLGCVIPLIHATSFFLIKRKVKIEFIQTFKLLTTIKKIEQLPATIYVASKRLTILGPALNDLSNNFIIVGNQRHKQVILRSRPIDIITIEAIEKSSHLGYLLPSSKKMFNQVMLITFLSTLLLGLSFYFKLLDLTAMNILYFASLSFATIFATILYSMTFQNSYLRFTLIMKETIRHLENQICRHIPIKDEKAEAALLAEVVKKNNKLLAAVATNIASLMETNN